MDAHDRQTDLDLKILDLLREGPKSAFRLAGELTHAGEALGTHAVRKRLKALASRGLVAGSASGQPTAAGDAEAPPLADPWRITEEGRALVEPEAGVASAPYDREVGGEAYSGLLGVTDSEMIFAGLLDLLRDDPAGLADAARETIRRVTEVCDGLGVKATLNLAVTDGTAMVFTRYSTEGPGNSLYFVEDGGAFVVASERLDADPAWREVPDRHLLAVGEDSASLSPL